MEELFVHALLWSIGYEKYDEYRDTLDTLSLINPQDEILLDLEERDYKDAMLHLYYLMNEKSFDTNQFGRLLMSKLKEIYVECNIVEFGKSMYELWQKLPQNIDEEKPFHVLCYADDPLSWGDEKQCRSLYEEAFNYYDN